MGIAQAINGSSLRVERLALSASDQLSAEAVGDDRGKDTCS